MSNVTHFLQVTDHDADFVRRVLDRAAALRDDPQPVLERQTLAMVFEKPSLRTRVSFEVAMTRLGGHAINLQPADIGLNTREPARDVARVLSGMCDVIMARVFDHATLNDLAEAATVPVINGLSDLAHPCQALADVLTIRDSFGDLEGRRVAYVGDWNNVSRSLAAVCGLLGMPFVTCGPDGYEANAHGLARLREEVPGLDIVAERDPRKAVEGVDVIYTDTWTSMGQEAEKQKRIADFAGYCVDENLVAAAKSEAIVMHCLPAYRGQEISAGVMESSQSRVFPQAHNRLHAQAGLLAVLLET